MKGSNRISKFIMIVLLGILIFLPYNYLTVTKSLNMMQHDASIVNALGQIRGSMQRMIIYTLNDQPVEPVRLHIEGQFMLIKKQVLLERTYQSYLEEENFIQQYDQVYQSWQEFQSILPHATPKEIKHLSEKHWFSTDQLTLAAEHMSVSREKNFSLFVLISNIIAAVVLIFMLYFVHRFVKKELEENASLDPLTKLYNRFYFDFFIKTQLAYFDRSVESLALLFIDIDHFKRVNDNYGHKMGDKVLEEVALIILQNLRTEDTAFRFGGEEFIVSLPNCDESQAMEISKRLLEHVSAHQFPVKEQLTISIGVTLYRKKEKVSEFIDRADQAMYYAKQHGRNQIKLD